MMIVTTTGELSGYRIVKYLGMVQGLTVRSRSVVGNFVGGIQSLFGGRLSAYVQLAEHTREEAYNHMVLNAQKAGANAVLAMRYDATEIMTGITEVIAYGTAVVVAPVLE